MSEKPANDHPEPLYFGDKRLDALYHAIKKEIEDRAKEQDLLVMTVVGVLEKVKLDLIKEQFWDQ